MLNIIHELFRWLAFILGWPLQLLLFKRKTYYEDKSVQSRRVRGGALVISNHYSVFDYMMNFFVFYGRKLHVVMIDRMYKKSKYFHILMDFFGGICANRDDMGMRFVDESVSVLEDGGLVQIFPEGHITLDGQMHGFKHAYLMIALRADAPILPVIVDGNYGVFRRAHIIIGKPICLSDHNTSLSPTKADLIELNGIVENKCRELKAELERRIASEPGHKKRKDK